ncbi:MAG: Uma2 family endonuclease [Gemmataceae bacterium]
MSVSTRNATFLFDPPPPLVVYPESDGAPIAENTLQFRWIVTIKGNLDLIHADQTDVFVAGDLFWYPVEGDPNIVQAPDVFVAFGRPKAERRSYLQWREGGIAPQVVFEILSHTNTVKRMLEKFTFYEKYGVEEYYVYDPDKVDLSGWLRNDQRLEEIANINGWTSPRLKCKFQIIDNDLVITGPDGKRFLTFVQLGQELGQATREREAALREVEKLRAQLRAQGIEPQA